MLQGKPLQDAKAFQKQQAGNLALSNLTEEFIKTSHKHKLMMSVQTVGWLTIPILVALFAVVPYQRKQSYNGAWEIIRIQDQKQGKRAALELLTEGCWQRTEWEWIPTNVASLLFGGCPSFHGEDLSRANLEKAIYSQETKLPEKFDPTKEKMLLIAPGVNLSGTDLSNVDFRFSDFQGINLTNANLEDSNLVLVQNLTPEQVKAAKNWEKANYSYEFKEKLGLK
ncbi:pentapeptide repeat-containing protein [Brunnivagina elsteri]|uniref:Pentapeptide repeat-containing protein n=1 Tax=Brunnivagina elsteri CCALA 953 TaxID=987040 RepID=A0A2A2TCJ9_9CYAN|nr:pentapeptide repeat-containing protein [Calothrix elsteri]PAX51355.1 hypothetical protein CK510_25215 [Calothrix elsteri CCALA 953]